MQYRDISTKEFKYVDESKDPKTITNNIGFQLAEKEIKILEMEQVNQTLTQMTADLEIRLMMGGL